MRFFAEPHQIEEDKGRIRITGGDVNHIRNVLRMRVGEEMNVSGGGEREYRCRIAAFEDDEVLLDILEAAEGNYELPGRIVLFQGLPKGDKMEWIVQKAVELGVSAIVPVEMKRCVVKLDSKKAEKKRERWQSIAESAAKQSRRMVIPEVRSVMSYAHALEYAKGLDIRLVPYELAGGIQKTRERILGITPGQSIGIFIGPEGGFEESEIQEAVGAGADPITLGRRILRTETAGLALLSVLMFRLEGE